jgi:hypothetical protein
MPDNAPTILVAVTALFLGVLVSVVLNLRAEIF